MGDNKPTQQNTGTDDDSTILQQLTTIPRRLQYFSEVHPERELFVMYSPGGRESCTAGRLLNLAGKFAGHLVEQGFKPGDVLANSLPNSLERLVTDLGAMMAGASAMHAPIMYADGFDFYGIVNKSGCRAVIMCPEQWSSAWCLLKSSITDQTDDIFCPVLCDKVKSLTKAVLVRPRDRDRSFLGVLEKSNVSAPDINLAQPDQVAYVFATTGSTGFPKLATKTHRDIVDRLAETFPGAESLNSTRGVVYFNDRLLGWVAGFPVTTYAYGDTRILLNSMPPSTAGQNEAATTLTAAELTQILTRENCNLALVMPNSISELSRHVKDIGLKGKLLEKAILAGTPIPKVQSDMALTLADTVIVLYGSTEAAFHTAFYYTDESQFEEYCCGKALTGVEFRVVDGNGKDCPREEVGDILIKAEGLFGGYLNVQESQDLDTAKTMTQDGWIDLGDYGYISKEDNLFVMGRKKDVIQYGTMMFYPNRLEAMLKSHPNVLEAVVLPVSDRVLYENICACLKVKAESEVTSDELDLYCRSLYQENFQSDLPTPKFFMILRDSEFPFTGTGKPDKQKLRRMAEEMFGDTGDQP